MQIDPFHDYKTVAEIVSVYQKAFGEDPWNEGYLCPVCNGTLPLSTEMDYCPTCATNGKYIALVEYWPRHKVMSDFYAEMSRHDAQCVIVRESGRVTGFAWGYRITVSGELDAHLDAPGLCERIEGEFFYLDECAVVPALQGNGVGTQLVRALCSAERVLLRTKYGSCMHAIVSSMRGEIVQHISNNRIIAQMVL
jgi:GNAT superfamily N-acetyltransferase